MLQAIEGVMESSIGVDHASKAGVSVRSLPASHARLSSCRLAGVHVSPCEGVREADCRTTLKCCMLQETAARAETDTAYKAMPLPRIAEDANIGTDDVNASGGSTLAPSGTYAQDSAEDKLREATMATDVNAPNGPVLVPSGTDGESAEDKMKAEALWLRLRYLNAEELQECLKHQKDLQTVANHVLGWDGNMLWKAGSRSLRQALIPRLEVNMLLYRLNSHPKRNTRFNRKGFDPSW